MLVEVLELDYKNGEITEKGFSVRIQSESEVTGLEKVENGDTVNGVTLVIVCELFLVCFFASLSFSRL